MGLEVWLCVPLQLVKGLEYRKIGSQSLFYLLGWLFTPPVGRYFLEYKVGFVLMVFVYVSYGIYSVIQGFLCLFIFFYPYLDIHYHVVGLLGCLQGKLGVQSI